MLPAKTYGHSDLDVCHFGNLGCLASTGESLDCKPAWRVHGLEAPDQIPVEVCEIHFFHGSQFHLQQYVAVTEDANRAIQRPGIESCLVNHL